MRCARASLHPARPPRPQVRPPPRARPTEPLGWPPVRRTSPGDPGARPILPSATPGRFHLGRLGTDKLATPSMHTASVLVSRLSRVHQATIDEATYSLMNCCTPTRPDRRVRIRIYSTRTVTLSLQYQSSECSIQTIPPTFDLPYRVQTRYFRYPYRYPIPYRTTEANRVIPTRVRRVGLLLLDSRGS